MVHRIIIAIVHGVHVVHDRVPGTRAADVSVAAAPSHLGMRPNGVPLGGRSIAVIAAVNIAIHHRVPLGMVLRHNMRSCGHRHMNVVIWSRNMHSVGLFHVDHLWWLWHWNVHSVMHHDRFHHGRSGHMDMLIDRWAWHVVRVVNRLDDLRRKSKIKNQLNAWAGIGSGTGTRTGRVFTTVW